MRTSQSPIFLGEEGRSFSQELVPHLQLAVLPLEFTQSGPIGHRQWFLLGWVRFTVLSDPIPQRARVDSQLPSHRGGRPISLGYHLDRFVPKLGRKLPTPFRHLTSSIPDRTLLGPLSGKWEARQQAGRQARVLVGG